ncbi:MAG: hypothetical protein AAGF11_13115 [Myxococcota bacterium]
MPFSRTLAPTRMWRVGWLPLVLVATACFNPQIDDDDDDSRGCEDDRDCPEGQSCRSGECRPASTGDDSCQPDGGRCTQNGECCAFDGTTDVGAGLCVISGEAGACTRVCLNNEDCATGCCGTLEGEDSYGACMDPSVCEGADEPSETCVAGVVFFCSCAAAAEIPCSDEELDGFFATCGQPGHELLPVFECYGSYGEASLDTCSGAVETCSPSAVVEPDPGLRATNDASGIKADQVVEGLLVGRVSRHPSL